MPMEPKDLVKVWDAPDHSILTPKQISIRLPIFAAARISALCEMYPNKNKTQIISDLIVTALDQIQESLPSKKGKYLGPDESNLIPDPDIDNYKESENEGVVLGGIYEDIGPKGRFLRLTKKHLRELEKEANIKEPIPCPDPIIYED
jgi:hypothetical protein